MNRSFRLVFRGEVLDGQHAAVVRKRLMQALALDLDRIERLFSGKAVVVRKVADEATAARFEALFAGAGARLRRVALEGDGGQQRAAPPRPDPVGEGSLPRDEPAGSLRAAHTPSTDEVGFDVAPLGADVLADEHKAKVVATAPDTSHLELDAPGATLGEPDAATPPVAPVPDFGLAEVGANLGDGRPQAVTPVRIDADFDVAEVGADIGEPRRGADPTPPSTDHIELVP